MPIFDIDPGQSPEREGTLSFFEQGADPATGFRVTSKGVATANGLSVKGSGSAAVTGRATLVAGTATVNTTAITAASNVLMTVQVPGGSVGAPRVASRVAGTSFTIQSSQGTDTSTVAWFIVEPST